MSDDRAGALAEEIRAWLTISTFFYKAFDKIRRHFGPLWFTINVLATQPARRSTFGQLRSALEDLPVFGSNSTSDLTNFLEHEREAGYVKISDRSRSENDQPRKEITRSDVKYFKSLNSVELTDEFTRSCQKYVQDICEYLFGWSAREKVKDKPIPVVNAIYRTFATYDN
jgi:hypothetical protein